MEKIKPKISIWASDSTIDINRVNGVDICPIKIPLEEVDAFCSLLFQARAKGYAIKARLLKEKIDQAEQDLKTAKETYERFIENTRPDQ